MKTRESSNDHVGDINAGSFTPLERLCHKDRLQRTNKGSRSGAELKAACNPPTAMGALTLPRRALMAYQD